MSTESGGGYRAWRSPKGVASMMNLDLTRQVPTVDELVRSAQDGVFVVDRARRYVYFSPACERMTGYARSEVVGRECQCFDIVGCRDEHGRPLSGSLCPAKQLFDGEDSSSRQRMQIRRKDKSLAWVETNYTALRSADGGVEFILGVIRDVSEQKLKEEAMLREMADLREQAHRRGEGLPASEFLADGGTSAVGGATTEGRYRLDSILEDVERQAIRRALEAAQWQRNKAAELMGISRSRLYRRMEALGMDPKALP